MKYVGDVIAALLLCIFNLSLTSSDYPTRLKHCCMIPIYCAGDRLECDNYTLFENDAEFSWTLLDRYHLILKTECNFPLVKCDKYSTTQCNGPNL
jgi:hypothetical protein